jgi:hypothetical protein
MSGAVKSIGKAASSAVKSVGKAASSVVSAVKKVAPIAAPIAMVAFPGIGTALGGMLGATGTTATLLGGGLIGAGASALGGKNPLTGAVLGAGGAYLGNALGGASGLLGGPSMGVTGATGLTPGAAGASGLYGVMPATSGYGLAASSAFPYAGAVGGALGSTGIFPTAAMNLTPAAGLLGGSSLSNMLRLGGSLLGGGQPQVQPPVQYQRQQPIAGQANFEPTISLLTNYGVA